MWLSATTEEKTYLNATLPFTGRFGQLKALTAALLFSLKNKALTL